jgi:hypothetical protein
MAGHELEDQGVSSPGIVKNLLFFAASRPVVRLTQTSIQWVQGVLSPWVKLQGNEDDHSLAEVKKIYMHASTSPYTFMAWYLIR